MFISLLLALSFAVAQTNSPFPPLVTDLVCITAVKPRSPFVSLDAISLVIRNTMKVPVDFCWSNFAGNLKLNGRMQPNEELSFNSTVGRVWNFRQTAGANGIDCGGFALSDPVSFKSGGLKDIGSIAANCPVTQIPIPVPKQTLDNVTFVDYQNLEKAFKTKFVTVDNIPKLIRLSFHDLANFDPKTNAFGGAHGCIFNQKVSDFSENFGLKPTIASLTAFVETNFPAKNFTMGDVISLAGKVAAEVAFPGTVVKWRFGRSACKLEQVSGRALAPSPAIKTIAEMQPFLDRYNLTAIEMAVLTSGAHAVALAQNFFADTSIFSFTFSTVSSGIQFIKDSQDLTKMTTFFTTWFGQIFKDRPAFGRFPSDMLFFPTTVNKLNVKPDNAALPVEAFLNSIKDDASFNTQFAAVFSKMLEIGVATETLVAFN